MTEYIEKRDLIKAFDYENLPGGVMNLLERILDDIPSADVVPWFFLERYADYFCAYVPYTEFIREAKMFYLDSIGAMEGGNIDG